MKKKAYVFIAIGIALVIGSYVLMLSSSFNYRFYRELEAVLEQKGSPARLNLAKLTDLDWEWVAIIRTGDSILPPEEDIMNILQEKAIVDNIPSMNLNTTYFYFLTKHKKLVQHSININNADYSTYIYGCGNYWLAKENAIFTINKKEGQYGSVVQLRALCFD